MSDCNKSFLNGLILVAIVTIVSMAAARYFVPKILNHQNQSEFTVEPISVK